MLEVLDHVVVVAQSSAAEVTEIASLLTRLDQT
jgi:hypothetical protein